MNLTYNFSVLDRPAIPSKQAKNREPLLPRDKRPVRDEHNKMVKELAKQKGSITVVLLPCVYLIVLR